MGAVALAGAPAGALADSISSENWSGYAAHRAGVGFRAVSASWRQPAAACPGDYPTFAAVWVGLGGYRLGARAVEQVGTELDCTPSGQARLSAWYELVPALPVTVPITVRPGDRIVAGVSVSGARVTLRLADRTRGRSFSTTVRAASLDLGSADWIVEAPTECDGSGYCVTLPLADFGTVRLGGARVRTAAGRWGAIASRLWRFTRIRLRADPDYYAADGGAALATPSALRNAGSAFDVRYTRIPATRGARAVGPATVEPAAVDPGGARRAG